MDMVVARMQEEERSRMTSDGMGIKDRGWGDHCHCTMFAAATATLFAICKLSLQLYIICKLLG